MILLLRREIADARNELTLFADISARTPLVAYWEQPLRSLLHDASGDVNAAVNTFREWQQTIERITSVPDLRSIGASIVRILQNARAVEQLSWLLDVAVAAYERADGVRSVQAAALVVRGMICGDTALLLQAVDAATGAGRPFELAEARAETSLTLLRAGDEAAGAALVNEAMSGLDALGADLAASRLAQQAREFGIRVQRPRPRARARKGWDALTTSERKVAALVAEGLTNAEIGRRLFISKGTVATHIRSAFRKTGVTSRAELAAGATRIDALRTQTSTGM
jgi:DNA-binding CsgD family transcriptional regulator